MIPFLAWLVRKFNPQIMFLMDTKSNANLINKLALYLGFANVASVDTDNYAGGLILSWMNDVKPCVNNNSKNYFACIINDVSSSYILVCTYESYIFRIVRLI